MRLLAHSQSPSKYCPWDKETTDEATLIIQRTLGFPDKVLEVEAGQPFRLDLLRGLAERLQDIDSNLPETLKGGVHTGYHMPIPPSGVWKRDFKEKVYAGLDVCDGNWQSAEVDEY